MKVAIISLTEGEGHGSEIVLEQLLQAWNSSEMELIVCATKNSKICRAAKQIGFVTIELDIHDNLVSTYFGLRKASKFLPTVDLVHGWTARTFEWACYLAGINNSLYTCTLHDHPLFHKRKRQFIMKRYSKHSARLVCVSNAVKNECIRNGYHASMDVITNGLVDTGISNCASERPKIGFLGMYAAWKGFPIIKKWIEGFPNKNIEWLLYGDMYKEFNQEAIELHNRFPNNVILRGPQTQQTIFNEINILIHASTGFDPLPTVLIEAAMKGIPCIASDYGGAAEIVDHARTGFLFNPNFPQIGMSYLKQLFDNANIRKILGKNARKRFEELFKIDRMCISYKQLWESCLGN